MYQYDVCYAMEVQKAHPDKLALVKPVNPDDLAVADVIADWKKTPGNNWFRQHREVLKKVEKEIQRAWNSTFLAWANELTDI
jgi:hypothetical protein